MTNKTIELADIGEEIVSGYDLTYGDRTWSFPGRMSVDLLRSLMPLITKMEGKTEKDLAADEGLDALVEVVTILAGAEQATDILEYGGPVIASRLVNRLLAAYGMGESSASQDSLTSTGENSRPTSNGSTVSTSDASSSPKAKRSIPAASSG